MAKPTNSTTNAKGCVAKPVQTDGAKTGNQPKKVITFSTIDNFGYQSWRDFSDSRLIDPSPQYPIIEIEIALNFFPGGKSSYKYNISQWIYVKAPYYVA